MHFFCKHDQPGLTDDSQHLQRHAEDRQDHQSEPHKAQATATRHSHTPVNTCSSERSTSSTTKEQLQSQCKWYMWIYILAEQMIMSRLVLGFVSCSCFHVFYFVIWFMLLVSCFPCLYVFLPSVMFWLVLWFMCHVLIGCLSHVSCFPLVGLCHVTMIVWYI